MRYGFSGLWPGNTIKLTDEGWSHIQEGHPEITLANIQATLLEPVEIRKSKRRPDVMQLYYRSGTAEGKIRYSVVVVKFMPDGNFISTAYTADKIKDGEVVFRREDVP